MAEHPPLSDANFAKVVIRGPGLVENGRETIDLPGLPGSDLTLALVSPHPQSWPHSGVWCMRYKI